MERTVTHDPKSESSARPVESSKSCMEEKDLEVRKFKCFRLFYHGFYCTQHDTDVVDSRRSNCELRFYLTAGKLYFHNRVPIGNDLEAFSVRMVIFLNGLE